MPVTPEYNSSQFAFGHNKYNHTNSSSSIRRGLSTFGFMAVTLVLFVTMSVQYQQQVARRFRRHSRHGLVAGLRSTFGQFFSTTHWLPNITTLPLNAGVNKTSQSGCQKRSINVIEWYIEPSLFNKRQNVVLALLIPLVRLAQNVVQQRQNRTLGNNRHRPQERHKAWLYHRSAQNNY